MSVSHHLVIPLCINIRSSQINQDVLKCLRCVDSHVRDQVDDCISNMCDILLWRIGDGFHLPPKIKYTQVHIIADSSSSLEELLRSDQDISRLVWNYQQSSFITQILDKETLRQLKHLKHLKHLEVITSPSHSSVYIGIRRASVHFPFASLEVLKIHELKYSEWIALDLSLMKNLKVLDIRIEHNSDDPADLARGLEVLDGLVDLTLDVTDGDGMELQMLEISFRNSAMKAMKALIVSGRVCLDPTRLPDNLEKLHIGEGALLWMHHHTTAPKPCISLRRKKKLSVTWQVEDDVVDDCRLAMQRLMPELFTKSDKTESSGHGLNIYVEQLTIALGHLYKICHPYCQFH
jgi:hypothetical protein